MTAPHMAHGAKPPGSFLTTPCFLPIQRLRLQPLAKCTFAASGVDFLGHRMDAA
jgi:hypothetical protein